MFMTTECTENVQPKTISTYNIMFYTTPSPIYLHRIYVQIVNIYVQLLTPTQLFYRKGLKTLFYKKKFI
jgi:hypothetical protein